MKLSFLLFALSLFLGQGVSQSKRDLKSPSLRKAIAVGHVEKHQGHQDLTASIKAVESEAVHTDVNMTVSHYVARRLEATQSWVQVGDDIDGEFKFWLGCCPFW
jgi:hypothetical protein